MFYGAWIDLDGSVFYTTEDESHSESLRSANLYEKLRRLGKKLSWSTDELQKHLNLDIVYIALKLGYVRITIYNQQFAMQCLNRISNIQKYKITDLHKEFSANLDSTALFEYYLDDLYSSNSAKFSTLTEMLASLT